mgnify:CR=1 FL=1
MPRQLVQCLPDDLELPLDGGAQQEVVVIPSPVGIGRELHDELRGPPGVPEVLPRITPRKAADAERVPEL